MVRAAPAPAAIALCLCFSADLVKAAAAALVVGAVLSATEQHSDLSATVLQGFQCIPASDLPAADILAVAQGLQNRTAELSSAQLSCLARLLAAKNLTADFSRYPPDLLLFFDSSEVRGGTCQEFYAQASRGNLDLLPRGSPRRRGLLLGALACLRVTSSRLRPEQLSSLGALVCDMEPETIVASHPGILENLKLCPALTGPQRDALNAVLLGGGTAYGDPPSWDLQTLQNLGPLVLALNQTTLSLVAKAVRGALGRSIVATYSTQGPSQREKSLTLLRALAALAASSHSRLKRDTDDCPYTHITASIISDGLFFIYCTAEEFELRLSNEVLKANLKPLLDQGLPTSFLRVVKNKLDQIYPSGIPEEQLKLLGPLSSQFSVEEISSWSVTGSDTLLALLDGRWKVPQLQQLFSRYLALGGILTGPLLQQIGGENLCNLQEEQIEQIPLEAIRTAGPLNVASCSQTKKDQLYRKAQKAFAGQPGTPTDYYCQIRPYLGGAPAEDLKHLAAAGAATNMDLETFLALNPDELQKLGVLDVKHLLGKNLPSLKAAENETSVMRWLERQSQQELDCQLGIGLKGGMVEPSPVGTSTPPQPTASATTTLGPASTSPLVSTNPPVPGGTSHPTPSTLNTVSPSTHSAPSTPVPISTSPLMSTNPPAPAGTTHPAPATDNTVTLSTPSAPSTPVSMSTSPLASTNPPAPGATTYPAPATPNAITLSTHNAPSTLGPASTSPLMSTNPPAPVGTTHPAPATPNTVIPSTYSAPSTPAPASTSPLMSTNPPPPADTTHLAPATDNPVTSSTPSAPSTPVSMSTSPLASTNPPAPGATTYPAPATPNAITPSTHNAPSTLGPASTSPLVSTNPPAPAGTTHPAPTTPNTVILSTHNAPSTLGPASTSPLVSMNPPVPGGTFHPTPATPNTISPSTHRAPSTPVPISISPLVPTNSTAPEGTTHPAPTTPNTVIPSTHNAPSTLVPASTSPLVSTNPPAPEGTTYPAPVTPDTVTASTHSAPSTLGPASTSPLVSTNPPVPAGTTHPAPATPNTITPSTHNAPSTLGPNSTSAPAATTATEMNPPPHKPTQFPNSTVSTQKSVISSMAMTTTLACQTSAPPAPPSPSSTTPSSKSTKETPAVVLETARPTQDGYINLQPPPGSGSSLRSCLLHVLTAAVGSSLLRALL